MLQTPKTPKFVKPKDGKRYIRMLGVFRTLLDKWGHPQPGKPSIPSRRPLGVQLLPWFYHGNSYWRDRANRNRPKVQERTLRHRSNNLCRAAWRPHWPFMQKHLVRPQFATGFQKAPFGRRTMKPTKKYLQRLLVPLAFATAKSALYLVGSPAHPKMLAAVANRWADTESRAPSSSGMVNKRRRGLPSTRACSSWKWNPGAAAPGAAEGREWVLSIATKIVPGRVCPRTRQQLHARACGFFHVRR